MYLRLIIVSFDNIHLPCNGIKAVSVIYIRYTSLVVCLLASLHCVLEQDTFIQV